jgi:hypothetical protein
VSDSKENISILSLLGLEIAPPLLCRLTLAELFKDCFEFVEV